MSCHRGQPDRLALLPTAREASGLRGGAFWAAHHRFQPFAEPCSGAAGSCRGGRGRRGDESYTPSSRPSMSKMR